MSEMAVRCEGLCKAFGETRAVDRVDLAVEEGYTLALLGPSGCGKTTLLRLIAGFERPDNGLIEIGGRVVADGYRFTPPERRRVAMVFQDYALFPHLDVAANVGFGLPRAPVRKERVQELLDLVGLAGLGKRMPHELSGGEQQRVALARALAPRPRVVLLDEPFSNLDPGLRRRVRAEINGILGQVEATTIFVTHDREEALSIGHRVAVMRGGRMDQVGVPEHLFETPTTPFVAHFVGDADPLPAVVRAGVIESELGSLSFPAAHLAEGTGVEVFLRPDDVGIRAAQKGKGVKGVVVEGNFRGSHRLYGIRLSSGVLLHSLQAYTNNYPVGALIWVYIEPGHDLAVFQRELTLGAARVSGT